MNRSRTAVAAWTVLLVLVLAHPAAAGGLSFVQHIAPPAPPVNQAIRDVTGISLDNSGDTLYAVSGEENSLGVYARDGGTGALTFVEVHEDTASGTDDGLRDPTGVVVTGDGRCVYVTSRGEDKVSVFSRNLTTGALTWVETQEDGVAGVTGMESPQALTVSLDQTSVYVVAEQAGESTVVAFSRTVFQCPLTHIQTLSGLGRNARAIDGTYGSDSVYVGTTHLDGGSVVGAVTALSRNETTGLLSILESELTGFPGLVRGVAAAWDSRAVYATSENGNAVVRFDRNQTTGALTLAESIRDGGPVDGLKGAGAVTVDDSSMYVFVVGTGEDAISVLRHYDAAGADYGPVRFLEVQKDPNVDPPNAVLSGIATVADHGFPGFVYAGGTGLTVFSSDYCTDGHVGPDEQCDDGNFASGDGCSVICALELCGPAPASGCRAASPHGAKLSIQNRTPDTKDQLQLTWRGAATTLADFGDPTSTASYVVCLYDGSGGGQPERAFAAPAGQACAKGAPCWKAASSGYGYKDGLGTPDGLQQVTLRQGLSAGQARIKVKGQGINLVPPALPLDVPVTVQVMNSATGVCWEAVFSNVAFSNGGMQFKATSD